MKLLKIKATNFRSVHDNGWIDCDDATSLVGINETGKPNPIFALWKLKPIREEGDSLMTQLETRRLLHVAVIQGS